VTDTLEHLYWNDMVTESTERTYEAGVRLARLVAAESTSAESLAQTAERVQLAWHILTADRDPESSPLL
jgi:hypothetical protein